MKITTKNSNISFTNVHSIVSINYTQYIVYNKCIKNGEFIEMDGYILYEYIPIFKNDVIYYSNITGDFVNNYQTAYFYDLNKQPLKDFGNKDKGYITASQDGYVCLCTTTSEINIHYYIGSRKDPNPDLYLILGGVYKDDGSLYKLTDVVTFEYIPMLSDQTAYIECCYDRPLSNNYNLWIFVDIDKTTVIDRGGTQLDTDFKQKCTYTASQNGYLCVSSVKRPFPENGFIWDVLKVSIY